MKARKNKIPWRIISVENPGENMEGRRVTQKTE
jgi:hypothetical protein